MPELPEVETIRRELEPLLVGRTIRGVRIMRPDIVGFCEGTRCGIVSRSDAFEQEIKGFRIARLERRGKYLILRSDGRKRLLVIHLRLSGHLAIRNSTARPLRFERIRFDLSGGKSLIFVEPRVLGRVYLVRDARLPPVLKGLQELGLEPIQPEFDAAYLKSKIGHRTASIKGLLLDQRIAAGIGNIYSDEALFRAGIRPTRSARRIKSHEYRRLAQALRGVLRDGIRHMGTTMSDARYQRPGGAPGGFQKHLMVFDREGQPCRRCGEAIRSCRISNRTSRYCPKCQK
jgi:formamidopyrimidine-DNA glycosylase